MSTGHILSINNIDHAGEILNKLLIASEKGLPIVDETESLCDGDMMFYYQDDDENLIYNIKLSEFVSVINAFFQDNSDKHSQTRADWLSELLKNTLTKITTTAISQLKNNISSRMNVEKIRQEKTLLSYETVTAEIKQLRLRLSDLTEEKNDLDDNLNFAKDNYARFNETLSLITEREHKVMDFLTQNL